MTDLTSGAGWREMTKLFIALSLFLAASFSSMQPAHAGKPIKQAGNFGVGLGVGTTAAPISMKYFLSSSLSVQGNAGWWRGWWGGYGCGNNGDRDRQDYCGGYYRNAFGIGADLLYEGGTLVGNRDLSLDWEIGGGIGLGVGDSSFGMAAAFVTGLQLNIHAIPLDFVVEYRPALYIVPGFGLNVIDFTGHVRYYF